MPIPLAALLPLIGSALGIGAQALTNRANKKTSLDFYNTQRQDALADWNRQNQFNSPQAQMDRFKQAGLSPHLIYGQTNTAPPVRSVSADTPKAIAPQLDQEALKFPQYALMLETAQQNLENLKAQEESIKANTVKTNSETNWKNVNIDFFKATQYTKEQILQNQMLQGSSSQRLTEEQITGQQQRNLNLISERANIQARTKSILAQTDLSAEQKAQVMQMTQNAQQTFKILTEQAEQQKFETEFMQKLKALGIVGQMAYMIARVAKGK